MSIWAGLPWGQWGTIPDSSIDLRRALISSWVILLFPLITEWQAILFIISSRAESKLFDFGSSDSSEAISVIISFTLLLPKMEGTALITKLLPPKFSIWNPNLPV